MNIPVWLGERFAGKQTAEPADGAARGLGAIRAVEQTESGLHVEAELASVSARFLSDSIAEVTVAAANDIALPSFSRLDMPICPPPSAVHAAETEQGWTISSAALRLHVGRDPLRLSLESTDGEQIFADDGGIALTPRGWRANWKLGAGDRIYGLGAKTGGLERRGRRTVLWARDALVGEHSDPLYSSIPFFVVARGSTWIGVLLDSASRSIFDFGHTAPDRLTFGPRGGALVYVVFAGPSLRDVLEQYTSLTGRMPLPPRWSLGHHQSRYSYNDEEEVREIAAEFRRRDIPTDAIHLDIHYMQGFRVFTFHRKRFPQPQHLAADLAREGFRLVTIVDPGVKRDKRYPVYREGLEQGAFARVAGGAPFSMKVWPGAAVFPDFYRAAVRQWWGNWHRVYTDAGIGGIWNDMNEPAGWSRAWYVGDGVVPLGGQKLDRVTHRLDDGRDVAHDAVRNAYGHLQDQATHEGLLALRPEERPFVLTRSAFAGTQRFAAQWTGDVMSTWGALRQSLTMLMGLGISGQPFAGSDIGGFVSDTTPELFARWMQIGALAPFCRTHTSLQTHRQEPWSFGPRVESLVRASLKLRYRLLPYLYTCFWEASRTGVPVWRPLFLEFPEDERVYGVDDQVMIGPALLAAPVLEPGTTTRRVVLPHGTWFDWYSGHTQEGGRTVTVEAPLERIPLFVRASAAIPTQPEVRFADDRSDNPLIWEVFLAPGAEGEIGSVYEDDGRSFAYRITDDFRVTRVVAGASEIRFGNATGYYPSPRSGALVRLHGAGLRALALDGDSVTDGAILQMPHDGREHRLSLLWE